jgi:integrase
MGRGMKATALVPVTPAMEHYLPALIAKAGDWRTRARSAGACGRVYRTAPRRTIRADRKATSGLYPHAVRLARNRAGDAVEPRALRPGPRHSVSKGSTPVLSSEEATALLTGMDVSNVVGLRDRAIIAVMTYTFARVGAVVALTVEDYYTLVAPPP